MIVNSAGGQSDIQAFHTRSNLESFVEARGFGVEKEGGLWLIPFVIWLTWAYRSVILWLITWLV